MFSHVTAHNTVMSIYIYIYMLEYIYIYIHTQSILCVCVCVCVYTHTQNRIFNVRIDLCVCVCMFVYTHTQSILTLKILHLLTHCISCNSHSKKLLFLEKQ